MAQPSEALDRDHVAGGDSKSADAVKGGDTCAEYGCILGRINVWGNPDRSLGSKGAIFGN